MMWGTTPEADADLIRGREWIEPDNPEAAQQFLQTARDCFCRLGQFPEKKEQDLAKYCSGRFPPPDPD